MREYLVELRKEKGFSQQYVASELGITSQYYQMIEAGERQKDMNITLVHGLSTVFDIPFQTIFEQEKLLRENRDAKTVKEGD